MSDYGGTLAYLYVCCVCMFVCESISDKKGLYLQQNHLQKLEGRDWFHFTESSNDEWVYFSVRITHSKVITFLYIPV